MENSVFSPRPGRFAIFALGAPLFRDFQQNKRVCTKHCFQPKISTFSQFRTGRICTKQSFKPDFGTFSHCRTGHTTFERFSEKCTSLWKTAFSARDLDVSPFSHWVHHFLGIFSKINVFVQNTVFSPRSARFLNSALGASFYSDYQQSAPVCTKQSFKPDFSTFSHCRTGHTTFERFSEKCTSLWKTAFSARDLDVSPFSHWVHHFLGIFSKINVFVQNTVFSTRSARFLNSALGAPFTVSAKCTSLYKTEFSSPTSARFLIAALGTPLLSDFQQKCTSLYKTAVFSPRPGRFIFALGAPLFQFRTGRIFTAAKCTSLYKTEFQARLRHVFSLPHWAHHF